MRRTGIGKQVLAGVMSMAMLLTNVTPNAFMSAYAEEIILDEQAEDVHQVSAHERDGAGDGHLDEVGIGKRQVGHEPLQDRTRISDGCHKFLLASKTMLVWLTLAV